MENLIKFGRVVPELCGRTDIQTGRQTHDTLIPILHALPYWDRVRVMTVLSRRRADGVSNIAQQHETGNLEDWGELKQLEWNI